MKELRIECLENRMLLHGDAPDIALDIHSGIVAAADYVMWRKLDGADTLYSVWVENFGSEQTLKDKIVLHDGSFVPLRAESSSHSLVIRAGETFTLLPDSDYDYVEVRGTLRVSRDYDTRFKFIDLVVCPGGKLDMGSVDDPVLRNVEFIIKDVAIDTQIDPWQLGNGIVNLGTWTAHGQILDAWSTIAAGVKAGATEITLTDVPDGWEVGDELLIADTSQISSSLRAEPTARIAAINGRQMILERPLVYEHLEVRDPSGNIRLMPYVANITRNIVIKSDNPHGTRGHTIQTGAAHADVRYASFLGLGRTTATPLNNASVSDGVVTPGTNQVGRYAWHWHHVHPEHNSDPSHPHMGHLIGNYLDGSGIGKWGAVIHSTDDMHIADNVLHRFVGAGVVTEDGNEFRNVIERNFVTGSLGYGVPSANAKTSMVAGIPGGEGAGFWFHGSENYIRNNVSVNNMVGFGVFNDMHPAGVIAGTVPLEFAGNVALSNMKHGIETWKSPLAFEIRDSKLANNGVNQLLLGDGEIGSITLRDTLILAQGGVSVGIHSTRAYSLELIVYGGEILGCDVGTMTLRKTHVISGTVLQNRVNFNWTTSVFRDIPMIVLDDVISLGLPGLPTTHILTGQYDVNLTRSSYVNNIGYRVLLLNWQQSGRNYIFYRPHALPSNLAGPQAPEPGLTFDVLWSKYGMSIDGGPVPDGAVPLADSDGYISEFTGDTPRISLPVSRLIVVFPNPSIVIPRSSRTVFTLAFTGAPADLNTQVLIDGQLITLGPPATSPSSTSFRLKGYGFWNDLGWHTIKTWRTLDGEKVAGSEMVFEYFIGPEIT
jgi:hypothetical protein